jgi:hypothetical protein
MKKIPVRKAGEIRLTARGCHCYCCCGLSPCSEPTNLTDSAQGDSPACP